MPIFPSDQTKARERDRIERERRIERAKLAEEAKKRDMQILRDFANELRAREGLPPLAPDEPVNAIICRRGRR